MRDSERYPAIAHLRSVVRDLGTLEEFCDWLAAHDIGFDFDDTELEEFAILENRKPRKCVDAFLGIDRDALERERRHVIAEAGRLAAAFAEEGGDVN